MMTFLNKILLFDFLLLLVHCVNCLNILTVLPTASKSHWNVGSAIAKSLVEVGHEVTVISPFPIKNPSKNYHDVNLTGLLELQEEMIKNNDFNPIDIPLPIIMFMIELLGVQLCDFVLAHPNVVELLNNKNNKFDLIILEIFGTHPLIGFGEHFNAPVIGFSTFDDSKWANDLVGNPAPLSYIPNVFLSYTNRMNFVQRLNNAIFLIFQNVLELMFYAKQKNIYEKYFPNNKLSYNHLLKKGVSLILLNRHFSFGSPKPYLPNLIEIGGIQVTDKLNPLPEYLKNFIETSQHGVVYFSLGSNIRSSQLPKESQKAFLKAFSKLKQRVIWKFDSIDDEKLPENVLIQNWLPQNEILAHPNVKLFISHGGLLSITESIYHATPIIGIPIYGDQYVNIERADRDGWGCKINFKNLTFDSITEALDKVLNDKRYSTNVKKISEIFRDTPMTPKQTAVYWIEYVARYNGAPQLQSSGKELNFIEYYMLDVFAVLILSALCVLIYIFVCLRMIVKKLFSTKRKVE